MSETLTTTVTVNNKYGIHNRPSVLVAKKAATFDADIRLRAGNKEADARSVMQIMILAAVCGTQLEVTATGPDAARAIEDMAALLESDFDEAYR